MHLPDHDVVGMMIPGTPFIARKEPIYELGEQICGPWPVFSMSSMTMKKHLRSKEVIKVRSWMDRSFVKRYSKFGPSLVAPMVETDKNLALYWVGHEPTDGWQLLWRSSQERGRVSPNFETYESHHRICFMPLKMGGWTCSRPHKPQRRYPERRNITNVENPVVKRIPSTELASRRNPKEGFLVSANNNNSEFEDVGWFFSSDDRTVRMKQILSSKEKITIQDLKELHL